jgi:hypothetical protein
MCVSFRIVAAVGSIFWLQFDMRVEQSGQVMDLNGSGQVTAREEVAISLVQKSKASRVRRPVGKVAGRVRLWQTVNLAFKGRLGYAVILEEWG